MKDRKDFFSGIASKLSILMGGAVLVTGAQASTTPTLTVPAESNGITMQATGVRKPLPAKLTLKQQSTGFKLIAAHGSHSSHASHASHSSHSSRAA
jgi:His-Xaa-Ser system protein HxsD